MATVCHAASVRTQTPAESHKRRAIGALEAWGGSARNLIQVLRRQADGLASWLPCPDLPRPTLPCATLPYHYFTVTPRRLQKATR